MLDHDPSAHSGHGGRARSAAAKIFYWFMCLHQLWVRLQDIGRVAVWSDIGISHAFEVLTSSKDNKVYK